MESAHTAPDSVTGSQAESETGWRGVRLPILTAGFGVGLGVLLHVRDPHVEGSYGVCPLYALTGWYCPGCGGMRAVHHLTDGQIGDAVQSNLLAIPLVLALVIWVTDWTIRGWRGRSMRLPSMSPTTIWMFFVAMAIYTGVRNTPWGTWLIPT
ncbi:DUF2752 domain-containing protein [Nocardia sp. CNY236]|uniref:DUF2752 domain-containing protein n=1 Tax=Nocardia sp. CNY236 TaxID=1169152 RepID=UPI00056B91C9|nr:DUF2752 domain-containing protein [Nocardia sp. CNY236]